MGSSRILSVIDEITEAGCLICFSRVGNRFSERTFSVIYSHAKRNGLLVTVFSNGTLVTDEIVSLFAELPPKAVEISLYGAAEETSDRIIRGPGSHDKCLKGIRMLVEAGIRVKLKTVLMTLNRHEFFGMEKIRERSLE